MTYVVYNRSNDNAIVELTRFKRSYKSLAAARAAVTRASKKYQKLAGSENRYGRKFEEYRLDKDPQFIYCVAEKEYYKEHLEKFVERVNYMSGEKYMESVNTPYYCSPSSETYWSM